MSYPEPTTPLVNRADLGYLNLPKELEDVVEARATDPLVLQYQRQNEALGSKMRRKFMENPFVPIGLGVTVFALMFGVYQMKTGDKKMSQYMMRLRVGAQAFTVLALMGGVVYHQRPGSKNKDK